MNGRRHRHEATSPRKFRKTIPSVVRHLCQKMATLKLTSSMLCLHNYLYSLQFWPRNDTSHRHHNLITSPTQCYHRIHIIHW
jgi:hypothetical protein